MNEIRSTFLKSKASQAFKPSFGLRNAHVQTIFSSIGLRKSLAEKRFKAYQLKQCAMILDGGNDIRLQGYHNISGAQQSATLAILIHGWEGSHDSSYMKSMAQTLLEQGIDVFRLNLRDHGDTHHLNKEIFNSTLVQEVIQAIADLQSRLSYPQTYLLGFSLGGNFCLRVAAMAQDVDVTLKSVIAFCPVVHAAQSNVVLNQKRNFIYGKYFVRKWKRSLRKKLKHWPHFEFSDRLDSMRSLNEMNEQLIPKYTPYQDLASYFDAYAISGDVMANTIAPCHLFFAEDDMIIPVAGIQELANNPDLHVTVTKLGGHCGYIKNWQWDCWQDEQALAIIKGDGDAGLASQHSARKTDGSVSL